MIQVREIEDRKLWDDFIKTRKPHSFLHLWEWGTVQEILKQKILRLGIYDGNRLVGVALLIEIGSRRGKFFFCPHGPLLDWNQPALLSELVAAIKKEARLRRMDFLRFSQLEKKSELRQRQLRELGFRPAPMHMHAEMVWLLSLDQDESKLLADMRKSTRQAIAKAQKAGVIVRSSSDIHDLELFERLYSDTARRQQFVPFSEEYLQAEFTIFSSADKARVYSAEYQGRVVSGALILYTDTEAFYHQGASLPDQATFGASHLLQWTIIRDARLRGCTFYNFWGVVPPEKHDHPWSGLSLFKRGFGGFSEEYTHAHDLPLRFRYWGAWAVESLRRMKRRL